MRVAGAGATLEVGDNMFHPAAWQGKRSRVASLKRADVVLLAPSVAMQSGPQSADLLTRLRAGRSASRASLTATMCALADYLTERSFRAAPPGLPTVRAFQAAQSEVTRRWLTQLW